MARSLNKAILIGNLGADPEVRTTSGGHRVAQLSLATGRTWTDARGETQDRTEWHRVVVWGKLVDVVETYLRRGSASSSRGRSSTARTRTRRGSRAT